MTRSNKTSGRHVSHQPNAPYLLIHTNPYTYTKQINTTQIQGRFFRDSCRPWGRLFLKDLRVVGRDLSRYVCVCVYIYMRGCDCGCT